MTNMDGRRTPEEYLEEIKRAERAKLTIYVGFAAGVGKTYKMLADAHELKSAGVDVVAGYIETHGRERTREMIGDLEVIPRKRTDYKGVVLEELDVQAVIDRTPQITLIDELAHTNVPGSKNCKRYEDVEEILAAGINVFSTLNIQHLESINEFVERMTKVKIKETVPDRIVREAELINVDLPVDSLRQRLLEGQVYPQERVGRALQNFFTEDNLSLLRELALRETAKDVEARYSARRSSSLKAGDPERVMVAISSNPDSKRLIRRGSRVAGRMNTEWYVVYIETPREASEKISATAQRQLADNLQVAKELGAEVVQLKGKDIVSELVKFAREHKVTYVIVGHSNRSWWERLLRGNVLEHFIQEMGDVDVQVVS
ncbi:MAG: universal stress protein [Rubrobacter sp.]|nr:universal stress protein [Rubrobacter sp.]